MKVLLIIPTSRYQYTYPSFFSNADFPVGFAYLASALRTAGHEVVGLNPNNQPTYESAYAMLQANIGESLQTNKPGLIGLGGLCTDYKFIKDAIRIIRKLAPGTPIVCGGGIVNNDAEFIFNTLHPDFCVIGEGEEVLVRLAGMLGNGRQDYEGIPNLGYWVNGAAKFTKRDFNYIDINERAFPDFEPFGIRALLDKYAMATRYEYRYIRSKPRPMTIVGARGCPFSCTFCVRQKDAKYRARSMQNIMQEIKASYERYHFNVLVILDELFTANKDRLREFSLAILDGRKNYGWDFNWIFQTHASASLDREVLALAKSAGCYCFTYGLESASPQVLASMNKRTKPAQIVETLNIGSSVGLGFYAVLIYGDPAETAGTIGESMDFFSRHCLDKHISSGIISPYPGSALFKYCQEKGIIKDKLEYYEHIDEQPVNMTSIPTRLWYPWTSLLMYLQKYCQWVKSTDATHLTKETETTNDPIAAHYNKAVYKIDAECPYCGKSAQYRELLTDTSAPAAISPRGKTGFSPRAWRIPILGGKAELYKLRIIAKGATSLLLSFRHPLFKTLKVFVGEKDYASCVVTGCVHCNKRIKINVPPQGDAQSFNKVRKLLKGLLV